MITESKVYTCRKCQSNDLVKNGTNASGSSQYHWVVSSLEVISWVTTSRQWAIIRYYIDV